jgi:hypothetical protein
LLAGRQQLLLVNSIMSQSRMRQILGQTMSRMVVQQQQERQHSSSRETGWARASALNVLAAPGVEGAKGKSASGERHEQLQLPLLVGLLGLGLMLQEAPKQWAAGMRRILVQGLGPPALGLWAMMERQMVMGAETVHWARGPSGPPGGAGGKERSVNGWRPGWQLLQLQLQLQLL